MSEDEGTDASARNVQSEARADDGETADAPEGAAADDAAGSESAAPDGSSADVTDDSDAEAGPPETDDDVRETLDRVTEYDDELARKVNSIVEEARDLDATVEHQREELEDLRERIESQAETIGDLRAELEERDERLAEYEAEVEDLKSRLKRKQADFQNYKKRAKKRQQQIKDRAAEDLVERLIGVRDDLKRALEEGGDDAESLRDGVEMTLREFDRILEDENVEEIDPDPGTETDPQRHEVMMQVDSELPEGTVDDVFTPGYEMGGKVIQNAQVTVSNGALEAEGDEESAEGDGGSDEADADPDDGDEGDAIELGGEVADGDDAPDSDAD
jgi:molecular chaperone GrpE